MATDRIIYPPVRTSSQHGPSEQPNPAHFILTLVASTAGLVAVASLVIAARAWLDNDVSWIYALLPLWVLGPPIWFWCDYFLIYRRYGDPEAFDSFKHAQQISLAIWAALAFLLVGLAGADHFKPEKPDCTGHASSGGLERVGR